MRPYITLLYLIDIYYLQHFQRKQDLADNFLKHFQKIFGREKTLFFAKDTFQQESMKCCIDYRFGVGLSTLG